MLRAAALAAGFVASVACADDSTASSKHASSSENRLPALALAPVGEAPRLDLGKPSDKPLVINLWATWCTPCRKELPTFNTVAAERTNDVRFIGINIGETVESAAAFVKEFGSTYDHYVDGTAELQSELSITTLPASVFVRSDGTIAKIHRGALTREELEGLLASELGITTK